MRRALGLPPRSDAGAPTAQASTPAAPAALPKGARAVDAAPGANTLGAESPAPEPDPEVGTEDAADAAGDPQTQKGSAFNFAVETLRMTPEITYQDLKARAAMAGLSMPPIVYGRAKALLGLVPTRPRRSKSEAPRILRQVDTANDVDRLPALDGIRSIEQLVATVRALEQERVRLRAALAAIQDAVGEALIEE